MAKTEASQNECPILLQKEANEKTTPILWYLQGCLNPMLELGEVRAPTTGKKILTNSPRKGIVTAHWGVASQEGTGFRHDEGFLPETCAQVLRLARPFAMSGLLFYLLLPRKIR
ncbi:MAG: hypothetical protein N3D16_05740 [Anaerolineales bacterium]|nr:hypothetical protein [Anaerolineales bacterium]